MRWLVVVAPLFAACAVTNAPALAPVPPAAVEVAPLAPPPSVDTAALQAKADEAVVLAAKRLHEIAATCGTDWLETSVACSESDFTSIAADYQAYYAERGDVRHETGAYYSLPRLGGPTRTVEQVTKDLVMGCEDGCRSERNASINAALDEASEACKKAKSGFDACKTLGKRLAKNVRASEVERWEGLCEGRCEDHRAQVRYAEEIDRKRPKTPAEAARCEEACHKQHDGGWCGTGLLSCLRRCTPKGAAVPWPGP